MALGTVARVVLVSSFRNQIALNVLHYVQTSTQPANEPNPEWPGLIAATASGVLSAQLKECMSQEARFEGVSCRIMGPTPEQSYEHRTTANAGPGTADSPGTAPSQVCGFIKKRTGGGGRRSRGRMYVPFPPLAAVQNDDLATAAYRTLLVDLAVSVLTVLGPDIQGFPSTWAPCLYAPTATIRTRLITSAPIGSGFATQRRRGFYGKPNVNPLT